MDPQQRLAVDDTRLGAILLENPIVREEDLQRCLEIQALTGSSRRLGEILVEEGVVSYDMMEELLRVQTARRVAAAEPPVPMPARAPADAQQQAQTQAVHAQGTQGASFVQAAIAAKATDLYVCEGRPVTIRVGGNMRRLGDEPISTPEVWDFLKQVFGEKALDLLADKPTLSTEFIGATWCGRARAFRHFDGIGIAIRLHPATLRDLDTAGLPRGLVDALSPCKGLVLVVGESRCGVSETLELLQQEVSAQQNRLVLVLDEQFERPLAPTPATVVRRRVGVHTLSYVTGLLAATRENPDVVVVGDVSAPEAFGVALRLAEAGHLVIAGYRARSISTALQRAFDGFLGHEQARARSTVASLLRCAIAQTLVPNSDRTGLVLAYEMLCNHDAVRDLLREGNLAQLGLLLRLNQDFGTSIDNLLVQLFRAGRIRFEDAFSRAEDKTLLMTTQRMVKSSGSVSEALESLERSARKS